VSVYIDIDPLRDHQETGGDTRQSTDSHPSLCTMSEKSLPCLGAWSVTMTRENSRQSK
jgi:hypothetical protein